MVLDKRSDQNGIPMHDIFQPR